nr:PD40 domain-containing protein [Anaerolineaceae bacterium]
MSEIKAKRSIELDDYFKLKIIQDAKISPDGKKIIYTLFQSDAEKGEDQTSLWLYSLKTGNCRKFTSGLKDHSPAWSPDGKEIAFISSRNGAPQIFLLPVDGGEAQSLTDMKQGVASAPVWSPDGKWIAFNAGPSMEEPPDPSKPYRLTRNVYRFDAVGYLEQGLINIYTIPSIGGEATQLTNDLRLNTAITWSPDSQKILYLSMMGPEDFSINAIIKTVDLEANQIEILPGSWGEIASIQWSPDGNKILFAGTPAGKPIGSKIDLYILDMDSNVLDNRTEDLIFGIGGKMQADMPFSTDSLSNPVLYPTNDGMHLITSVHVGGCIHAYNINLAGKPSWEPIVYGERTVVLKDYNPKGL